VARSEPAVPAQAESAPSAILGESTGEPALVVLRHSPLPDLTLFDHRGGGSFRRWRFGLGPYLGNLRESERSSDLRRWSAIERGCDSSGVGRGGTTAVAWPVVTT
jgi:hypothetical protein